MKRKSKAELQHNSLNPEVQKMVQAPKPAPSIEERYNSVTAAIYDNLTALKALMATPEYRKLFNSSLEFTDTLDEKNLYGDFQTFVEDLKNFG